MSLAPPLFARYGERTNASSSPAREEGHLCACVSSSTNRWPLPSSLLRKSHARVAAAPEPVW